MRPAVDLLEGMLLLDPERRLTAKQGLSHPFLAEYHDPECEPDSDPYDDSFESLELAVSEWKSEFGRFANRQRATALINGATLYICLVLFTDHLASQFPRKSEFTAVYDVTLELVQIEWKRSLYCCC